MSVKIIINRIQCLLCNDIIESQYNHHYVSCKCGAVAVDGGNDYLKRIGQRGSWMELSHTKSIMTNSIDDFPGKEKAKIVAQTEEMSKFPSKNFNIDELINKIKNL